MSAPNDALRRDALGHADDAIGRHERRRMVRREIVERRTLLPAQLEQIGRAGGRAQHHARAGALEQHVRHDRRPVDDASRRAVRRQEDRRSALSTASL